MPRLAPSFLGLAVFFVLLAGVSACEDSDPTGPSSWETLTNGSVYEEGSRILSIRRDSPLNNRWRFAPNPLTDLDPPEGPGAPSRVTLQVTTFPESAGGGGAWIEMDFEGRGIELPFDEGSYPVSFVESDERLAAENLGVFTGELKMGRGQIGGADLLAEAISGEIEITRVIAEAPPSRRVLVVGRLEIDFREQSPEAGEPPREVRAEFTFRSSNSQGF